MMEFPNNLMLAVISTVKLEAVVSVLPWSADTSALDTSCPSVLFPIQTAVSVFNVLLDQIIPPCAAAAAASLSPLA